MKIFLGVLISLFTIPNYGKSNVDSTELEKFWIETITPLINNNKSVFIEKVNFPLQGEWGFLMELEKPQSEWTKEDFEKHFNKLFTKDLISQFKTKTYKDVEVIQHEGGITELLVGYGIGYHEDGIKFESGVIFRFKKIDGLYKLYLVQAVG